MPQDFQQYFEDAARRVLVIDDDPAILRFVDKCLSDAGFRVMVADNGFTAGLMVGAFRPAVIFLDLQMPGIQGSEMLKYLRSVPQLSYIQIILISAKPADEIIEVCVQGGADSFLQKPLRRQDLIDITNQAYQSTVAKHMRFDETRTKEAAEAIAQE